jgi:hypothetical protein
VNKGAEAVSSNGNGHAEFLPSEGISTNNEMKLDY